MTSIWTNQDGPHVWDVCTGEYRFAVMVNDPDGITYMMVPTDPSNGLVYSNIAENNEIYEWCDARVQEDGYAALDGDRFITIGGNEWTLAVAYNFGTNTYDLIAFRITSATVDGVIQYTASQCIIIAAGTAVAAGDTFQYWVEGKGRLWLTTFLEHGHMRRGRGYPTADCFDFRPQARP